VQATTIVVSSNDDNDIVGLSTRKAKMCGPVMVIPACPVKFQTPPPSGEEDEDKLGAAVRSVGKAVEGVVRAIQEFSVALGRIGEVIGKYDGQSSRRCG
jgi:hypothetical protein